MKLEEFELIGIVDDYIRDCMKNGTTLMRKILANKDVSEMVKYTYWEKNFKPKTLDDFENSIQMAHVYKSTTNWAVKKIQEFVNSDKRAIVIFEERIVDSTDAHLIEEEAPPYFTSEMNIYNGKEVYYYVNQTCCTKTNVESSLNLSGKAGPFSSGVLIILPDGIEIKSGVQVSKETLEDLSSNVQHLIFGAFDLDGYIFCSSGKKL